MKHILIAALALLSWSPLFALETSAGPNAEKLLQTDPGFKDFASEVISATAAGDAERLKKLAVVGKEEGSWKATEMGLKAMTHMKVLKSSYEVDLNHKEYEKKGVKWNLAIPADGQLAIVFKIAPQEGLLGDETKVSYMIAKTGDGWRVVMPTTKK